MPARVSDPPKLLLLLPWFPVAVSGRGRLQAVVVAEGWRPPSAAPHAHYRVVLRWRAVTSAYLGAQMVVAVVRGIKGDLGGDREQE